MLVDDVMLTAIEPSITFAALATAATGPTAEAALNDVNFASTNAALYAIGSLSQSGKTFGVIVNKTAAAIGAAAPGNNWYISGAAAAW
jgi:hypothetical protein